MRLLQSPGPISPWVGALSARGPAPLLVGPSVRTGGLAWFLVVCGFGARSQHRLQPFVFAPDVDAAAQRVDLARP